MSNPMKYIKDLEAAGFERNQAEAQVQMVLDALEGDLVTKSDFAVYQEKLENRFAKVDSRFEQMDKRFEQMEKRFEQSEEKVIALIKESELRTVNKLGTLVVSTGTIMVAVLAWLIKVN